MTTRKVKLRFMFFTLVIVLCFKIRIRFEVRLTFG